MTTALWFLARAGVSRVLRVEGRGQVASVAVRAGRVRWIEVSSLHAPVPPRHIEGSIARGVAGSQPRPREGFALERWRRQLEGRLADVFTWSGVRITQAGALATSRREEDGEGVAARDLILAGLRVASAEIPPEEVERVLGRSAWVLSHAGQQLVEEAALHPDEEAAVTRLRRPTQLAELRAVVAGSPRALRLVWALAQIDAACVPLACGASMALLLATSRAARRSGPLVELRGQSAAEARAGLRRLAARLHPDRLGPHAPVGIVAASTRVVGALNVVGDGLRPRR